MFHAMRRIVDSLMHQSMGEGALDRAINSSFLGNICLSGRSSPVSSPRLNSAQM